MNLNLLIAIALGSAVGGVLRFVVQYLSSRWLLFDFPVGTLLVNTLGCLVAGFLLVYWQQGQVNPVFKSAVMIGFLGALTTFSAFSVDTLTLIQSEAWLKAGTNVVLNLLFSLIAVFFGAWIGGRIAQP